MTSGWVGSVISIAISAVMIGAGALWYWIAPRWQEHSRSFWRIKDPRFQEAQDNMRYIGTVFLVGVGTFGLMAVALRALRSLR